MMCREGKCFLDITRFANEKVMKITKEILKNYTLKGKEMKIIIK